MAEESGDFEIVMNKKAKSAIRQHCNFIEDKVSKTKKACRHCQIILKYIGDIFNFSNHLTRKHSAVFLSKPFFFSS